jgi:hypothetical protein
MLTAPLNTRKKDTMKMMRAFVAVMAVVTTFNALLAVSKAESVEGLDKFMGVRCTPYPSAS